jgi:uncharacterized protein (TIGR02300 family)
MAKRCRDQDFPEGGNVAKPEWGSKRLCTSCGARFYDLQRDPILCPKCGAQHDPLANVRQFRSRSTAEAKVAKPAPAAAEPAEEDDDDLPDDADLDEMDDEEEDDDMIEDASELGEEDEDVIDVAGEDDDDKD